jgi:signal transduction histidine kinase/CheY-like chemotaxis protein
MAAVATGTGPSPMEARVDLQMLQDTWRTAPSAIPGQASVLLLLMWTVHDWHLPAWHWLLPGIGLLATWTVISLMGRHFRRFGIPASGYGRWRWNLLWWHGAQGALWGLMSVALLGVASPDWKLALVAGTLVYGYTIMLVTVHDWAVAFTGASPLLVMAATRLLMDHTPSGNYLALVMVVSLCTCMLVARRISRRLREGTLLRNENADLVLQLRDEIDKVTQAKARAEIADRQKGEFFASASHDLRQPLHVMMLLSSALRPHVQGEEGPPLLGKIQTALGSLSTMFEKMFDVARIDAQRIDYRAQACELSTLWARLDAEFDVLCASKGLHWRLDPTSDWVQADLHVLERILRNLLNNAVRYTEEGEVRLRARVRGPWVVCQVWDTGVGVARAHRHRVFEDYFQGHNDGRRSSEGLGLGLAVVRRLSMLGPTPVTLRSRPGRGSCFSVRLPRLVPAAVAAPGPRSRRSPDGSDGSKRRGGPSLSAPPVAVPSASRTVRGVVLLIEDEPDVLDGTTLLLGQHGWLTAAGTTPDGAVASLLALQAQGRMAEGEMPVAVISDHRLGLSINGLGAIQLMRYEFGEALPAFLLTGEAAPGLADQAREAQVHLLHKPVQAERLLRLLSEVVPAPTDAEAAQP